MLFRSWSGLDPDLVWYPILSTGQYQSYYTNKELDALLEKGRTTVDAKERLDAYRAAAKIIKEDAPHIPLFQPATTYVVSSRMAWTPRGDTMVDFRRAEIK